MDKKQSRNIVKETLQNPFDKEKFVYFAKNLLNKIDESKNFHAHGYIPEASKDYVKTYERIATYTDPGGNKIDILIVYLQKETSLERARTSQRNFVAHYLKDRNQKDAGLVAFVSPDSADWRFSLVKMDYKFEESKGGKIKVKEEFTPARRWSFLVGANENSHTAQSRLAPIVEDDQNYPTLKQLEDAFNIEKVTKEFFEKYRDLFLRTNETLIEIVKNNPALKKDFQDKNVDFASFSKKLLGQIVFLYFLQKKGWFGVPMDKTWGEGDKKFLRTLFQKSQAENKNYFNYYLEPLFYEALAKERDDDFYSRFECKIPFLNGGLFDPISNYDWVNTIINLPDDLFSNERKTKEGDIGDGILDFFDRYNFTVKEDEPLEKEVAVDPEMLGKVFENLLEVKDRKSKGTYYTPREIVHYMCQQSLINYLLTETGVDQKRIEQIVKQDFLLTKEDYLKWKKYKEQPENKVLVLWEGEWAKLDKALENIKVVDPACGSGAFLVGMLQEIVKARKLLQSFSDQKENIYSLKEKAIKNNIYGVDIDPGAVEIAKLRLWLSLVVDESDIRKINPLPNLDYKIMQGNSLLEEFEGVNLFDEKIISTVDFSKEKRVEELKIRQNELSGEYIRLHQTNKLSDTIKFKINSELKKIAGELKQGDKKETARKQDNGLFDSYSEAKRKAELLQKLHKEFFETTQKTRKKNLKNQIEKLEWELIEATLKEQNKNSELKKLEEFKKSNTKPFFLWKLHFADVFQEKGGFDIAIANPPYFPITNLQKNIKDLLFKNNSEIAGSFAGKIDIYSFFILKSLKNLIKKEGYISYIIPKTLLSNMSFSGLREFIMRTYKIKAIVDLEKVFSSVTGTMTYLLIFIENKNPEKVYDLKISEMNMDGQIKSTSISIENLKSLPFNIWVLSREKLLLLSKLGKNSALLKDNYITKNGVCTGDNKKLISKNKENDFYKKIIVAKDISKYHLKKASHFVCYKPRLLHRPREIEIFKGPKIVSQMIRGLNTVDRLICAIDYSDNLSLNSVNIIRKKYNESMEFLLGIINSKLINYYFASLIVDVNIKTIYLDIVPIKIDNIAIKKNIENYVNKILAITESKDYLDDFEKQVKVQDCECQIDKLVYELYNLTPEEIEIIENSK